MHTHTRVLFFSREIGFRLKYFVIAPESNGHRPGRACVAAHRTGIWACQGHDPLFLWLRWVEVSPKRFSLHARYSFYPSKYAASPQVTKVCVPLFLFSRRERDGRGDAHDRPCFAKMFQVSAVVSLSAAALVAVPNSQYGNPYMSIFFCDCNPRPMCGRR